MGRFYESRLSISRLCHDAGSVFDVRREYLAKVSAQYMEKACAALIMGASPRALHDAGFARLLQATRFVSTYAEIIENLENPQFDMDLDGFEGII